MYNLDPAISMAAKCRHRSTRDSLGKDGLGSGAPKPSYFFQSNSQRSSGTTFLGREKTVNLAQTLTLTLTLGLGVLMRRWIAMQRLVSQLTQAIGPQTGLKGNDSRPRGPLISCRACSPAPSIQGKVMDPMLAMIDQVTVALVALSSRYMALYM